MTITYGELRDRVLRILDGFDADGETDAQTVSIPATRDAISAALHAILPWASKQSVETLTAAADTYAYALPDDLYAIESVVDSVSGEVNPSAELAPDTFFGDNTTGVNAWTDFPHGSITFSKVPGDDLTLFYLAHWTEIGSDPQDTDELEPPDFAMTGLALYAASQVMLTGAVSITEIRQFATKVDSGNPEHNPMMRAVNYLLKLFASEMNRHPKHQRVRA